MKLQSNYTKLFAAFSLTFLGDGLTIAAVPWLISTLTSDTLYASVVMTAMRLPWLLFSLPIGILIDRYSRKHLLVGAGLIRMSLLILLTAFVWIGWISIPMLALFMFGIGLSRVVFDSTVQTVIPQIVGERKLEKANGQFTAGQLITSDILGVALGGFILTFHLVFPFAIDALTAIVALLLLLALKGNFAPGQVHTSDVETDVEVDASSMAARDNGTQAKERPMANWRRELTEGIVYVIRDRFLRSLALLSVTVTLMYAIILSTQIFFVREVLHLEAYAFGILIAVATVGSIIGSQAVARMRNRWSPKQLILQCVLGMGIIYGLVGLTTNAYAVGSLYFGAAFFIVVYNVVRSSILQRTVPNHLLGRVGSVFRFLSFGVSAIGTLLGGLLVRISEHWLDREFSLQLPYLLLSGVYLLAALWFALQLRGHLESSGQSSNTSM